jgi:hypothetical protein
MPSQREPNRVRLFARYSENLALVYPQLKGKYVCPLCLRDHFTEDSVWGANPQLTEEHCIPDGLGDNIFVLTCAVCNNTTGGTIDSHLQKRLRFREFWEGNSSKQLRAWIDWNGNNLAVNVRRTVGDSAKMEMFIVKKASSREAIRRAEQSIRNKDPISTVKLHFGPNEIPDTRRSRISLLKTAYLLIFRQFGYSYILHHELDPVRQQILNPKEKILPLEAIVLDFEINELPPSIAIVTDPESLAAYVVPIRLDKHGVGKVVAMPSHSNTFANWQRHYSEHGPESRVRLSCSVMAECNILNPDQHITWEPAPSEERESS